MGDAWDVLAWHADDSWDRLPSDFRLLVACRESERSAQHLDRDLGETLHLHVVGQEQSAAVLDRGGQVERIERLEVVHRPDARGPLPNWGSQWKHAHIGIVEEGSIIRQDRLIIQDEGTDQAFQAMD